MFVLVNILVSIFLRVSVTEILLFSLFNFVLTGQAGEQTDKSIRKDAEENKQSPEKGEQEESERETVNIQEDIKSHWSCRDWSHQKKYKMPQFDKDMLVQMQGICN